MQVYILLDRSASMGHLWDEAVDSINTYVKGLGKQKAKVKMITFDSIQSYEVIRESTVKSWTPLTPSYFAPRGMTPLYDAAAKMFAEADALNDKKTVFVIMTDGLENASKEVRSADAIKSYVKRAEDKDWPVVFLGANFDKVEQSGAGIGIKLDSTVNFHKGKIVRGMAGLSVKTQAYFGMDGANAAATMLYTDKEKAELSSD